MAMSYITYLTYPVHYSLTKAHPRLFFRQQALMTALRKELHQIIVNYMVPCRNLKRTLLLTLLERKPGCSLAITSSLYRYNSNVASLKLLTQLMRQVICIAILFSIRILTLISINNFKRE